MSVAPSRRSVRVPTWRLSANASACCSTEPRGRSRVDSAADRAGLARSGDRLPVLLRARTSEARAELTRSGAGLAALNPFATLERGYAIVRTAEGRVVTQATGQAVGAQLEVRLARGALDVIVDGVRDSET